MTRGIAIVFAYVSLLLLGAGVAYGFAGVNVTPGDSCGNAFHASGSGSFSSTGDEACAQARSERKPMTAALITAGLLGGLCAVAAALTVPTKPVKVAAS